MHYIFKNYVDLRKLRIIWSILHHVQVTKYPKHNNTFILYIIKKFSINVFLKSTYFSTAIKTLKKSHITHFILQNILFHSENKFGNTLQ